MQSIEFTRYGSPDFLNIHDVDMPEPKPNEILVKIFASSINSWDWELLHATPFANRAMFGLFKPCKLKTLGADVAGCVEAIGNNVTRFKPGDKVYGDLSACGWGGFAQYVAAPEQAFAIKPEALSYEQAASVPQAGLMALQGLEKGKIDHDQKILINGASGGSGSFAVQIAKSYNAEITGVCSTNKLEFVKSLGCDHVIDYKSTDYTQSGEQYDLVLDAQGHHSIRQCRHVLNAHGSYVMLGGDSWSIMQMMALGPIVSLLGKRKLGLLFHRANQGFDQLNPLLESGKVTPCIDKVFPLEAVPDALRYYGDGLACGKIVIQVNHNSEF